MQWIDATVQGLLLGGLYAQYALGMSLMFGVLMIVNLRLVGWLRGMSFASVHRLLPFGLMGFGINFITGMFFFIVQPLLTTATAMQPGPQAGSANGL